MKTYVFFISLMLSTLSLMAGEAIIKKKSYNKSYSVKENAKVAVSTHYGNVNYKIGKNNWVQFMVEVVVDGRNESAVNEKLNSISVAFSQNGNEVKAVTQFENCRSKNTNMKINYTIYVPESAFVSLSANYVDLSLPKLKNEVNISGNYLDIFPRAQLGDFHLSGNYCDLESDDNVGNLQLKGNYLDVKVGDVKDLYLSGNYTDLIVDQLSGDVKAKGNYLDVYIKSMSQSPMDIQCRGNYLDIKIKPNDRLSIFIEGLYTDFSFNKLEIFNRKSKGSHTEITGQTGYNVNSKLSVSGNYNDIILK